MLHMRYIKAYTEAIQLAFVSDGLWSLKPYRWRSYTSDVPFLLLTLVYNY